MQLQDYEKEHAQRIRSLGAECTLFLKRNGDFPLQEAGEIALFGSGARRTVKGGTGSGEVNSRYFVTVEQGLENAGFTVTSKYWLDTYDALRKAARENFMRELQEKARREHKMAVLEYMGVVMPEPDYTIPLYGEGDTAIYVLSRISGEGSDREAKPGDILLTETEIRDILALQKKYKRFLLVLNVGGVVDLSPVQSVENVLLLSQLGAETGSILADLLLGKSFPSGKLSTTWAAWADYPTVGDFGGRDETRYKEGVFVGYRYFDSVEKKPLFPFGFGLGYTDFEVSPGALRREGEEIFLKASVRNTGVFPGKETVQLYVSQPGQEIAQPWQVLAAFQKTPVLQPGESCELELSFNFRDLAYYDEDDDTWTLEKGTYLLRLGSSSADTRVAGKLLLNKDAVTLDCRACCGKPDFKDWSPKPREKEKTGMVPTLRFRAKKCKRERVVYRLGGETDLITEELSDEELALLNVGAFEDKPGLLSTIGNAGRTVAGAAGETCRNLREKGIPALVMADGPAGLRLSRDYTVDEKGVHPVGDTMPESILELMPKPLSWLMSKLGGGKPKGEIHHQYATAIPIGTAIAQSWNRELAEACGDVVGEEMLRFGVHLWLAPALNLHRDIRCGRNFEYYSEDPLLSGKMAAGITRGVQKHPGCAVTIKHYAANNQEYNRYNSNSQVSQRALREMYLRGFGICVRESAPLAVMTSYNLLNGTHTSEQRDLIHRILRCEFGFGGIVMTDWIIPMGQGSSRKYPAPNAGKIAAAGGDLVMPGGKNDQKAILKALKKKKLTRQQLRVNATRVIRMARKLTEEQNNSKFGMRNSD